MRKINKQKLFYKIFLLSCVFGISITGLSSNEHKTIKAPIIKGHKVQKISNTEEKCKVNIGSPAEKMIYLTFDDGPNIYTEQILNVLKKENVRGTFFIIGSQLPLYKKQINKVIDGCHTVGTHSMTHISDKLYNSQNPTFVNETLQLKNILQKEFKYETDLARAPYGSTYLRPDVVEELKQNHIKMWDWTVDSLDWKYGSNQAHIIVSNVLQQIEVNKERNKFEVVLLHERESTVKALPYIIKTLKEKGYSFKSYDEKHHIPVNFKLDENL